MKRTLLSVAILVTMLTASCSKNALIPEQTQAVESSVLFGARAGASLVGLPTATLPANVKSYLDQNVSGYTLIKVEKMSQPGATTYWGTKVTVLQNGVPVDYFFDTNGALTTRPAGPRGEVITRLTAAQLPASVSSYLGKTYAGYQLVLAESMQINGSVQEYRVQILSNNQRVDVHFDGSGNFRDAHTAPGSLTTTHSVSYLSRTNLPDAVKTALSSTYSTYTYGWAEQHVHDGTTTYDVKLFSNNQPVVLHFNTSGALVTPVGPAGPAIGGPASGTAVGGPTPPVSGTLVGGPVGPAPKPGGPSTPVSGTMTSVAPANHQLILDATQLPSAITTYLQTNFSGYTYLVADLHTPPMSTTGQYMIDIAVGQQLYKLRFSATGELLMAEARG
ncbi:PepSY-like domain-containing protein [Fibrella forsythiae]|uniref:PepSY-like domain-containing protein n=1 Tax=Fibrella forsythiae TaxID=2817061 RepID=A0ABS3JEN2_9BACT|nr:PepSY-like domain-containing protein [Fibrella forsythiae]MBO0948469.1 PepSY-like domain-containing protein [Fibrella forsythiae]